jgi:hypothetical protein
LRRLTRGERGKVMYVVSNRCPWQTVKVIRFE